MHFAYAMAKEEDGPCGSIELHMKMRRRSSNFVEGAVDATVWATTM